MAASGYTPIILFNSTTTGNTPTTSNLAVGELAINVTDGKLFFNQSGTIKVLANATYATSVSTISFGTTGLTPSTATNGVVTVAGTLAVANGGTGVTTSTGSGSNVLSTSPTLVTPILGTPTSVTLTNATGLPLTTGVTGTLATTNGGTGLTSFTSGGVVYASSTSALATGSALTFDGSNLVNGGNFSTNTSGLATYFRASGTAYTQIGDNQTLGAGTAFVIGSSTPYLAGNIGGSEQMRLTSTGLGIGTSSPGSKLTVSSTGSTIELKQNATGAATYYVMDNTIETGGKRWRFGYTGAVGIPLFSLYNQTDNVLAWAADASGNLGLGVTPSAWVSGRNCVEIGGSVQPSIAFNGSTVANGGGIWTNGFNNGTNNVYKANGTASRLDTGAGGFAFYLAPSGTAGNAITFTQAMTLDASGNLLVGTTSASGATSNTAKVVGGQFKSVAGTVASSATATTMFTMATAGTYYVSVQYSASNAAAFDAFAIIIYDGSSQRIALQSNGTQISITLSGANVQVTNNFNSATINWSYMLQSIL